mmetsp:Transcript_17100/g.33401  ORF Transcript_17100/g.33401 Transcript_17100/m.33401 type:complete len:212 (-) Transcript_17100:310-945(-)
MLLPLGAPSSRPCQMKQRITHYGLARIGLAFEAHPLKGLLLKIVVGAEGFMAGPTLTHLLSSNEKGCTSDNHECSTKSIEPEILGMRILILGQAFDLSRKIHICHLVVIIVCGFFIGVVRLILAYALHVICWLLSMAYKPFLAARVSAEAVSTALFIFLVAGECQLWMRLRHLGAIPTFGAFHAALPVAFHLGKTCLTWLLAASFDHAVLP